MLDIKTIRSQEDDVRKALASRGKAIDLDRVVDLDQKRRTILTEVETLKSERNAVSKEIGALKKAGEDAADKQTAMRELGQRISALDNERREIEEALEFALLAMPNTPDPTSPVGTSEEENQVVRTHGEPRSFSFEPLPHYELGAKLDLFDFERSARLSGAGFPLLTGQGARLQRALIQFMLDLHTTEHGYREVAPPILCNRAAMTGTGQLPKMEDDMYRLPEDDLFLIPTAEVPVTNIYREEIIKQPLPIYLTAHTPCFRREAGAAGKDTRGMIRLHQFDKVEMVKFVEPNQSAAELELLVQNAEEVLKRLGLHYRILELCTGDLSFAAAKCYDIELWAPANKVWLEVSSCSNFRDFQARRAQIRYKDENGKTQFVHTLNGSGVALPRLLVAILENYQEADGSVVVPDVIRPYMGGLDRLVPGA